jgi:hypothetical protein
MSYTHQTARIVKLSVNSIFDANATGNGTAVWETVVFSVCGLFSIVACLLAFFLIYRHLKHFTEPKPQTNICRILLMVPIYAIDSWLSIYFRHYSIYFDLVRDSYEVPVPFSLFSFR